MIYVIRAKRLGNYVFIGSLPCPCKISATISRPSFPTLERIAAALEVEPWQLLAPPSVVEELKQARAQRLGVGGGGLVGVVRVGCEIYTADTVQQLRAIVERLERAEGGTTK